MMDPKDLPTSFWQALAETVPRLLFGDTVVESWRAEDARHKQAESLCLKHMEEARRTHDEGVT